MKAASTFFLAACMLAAPALAMPHNPHPGPAAHGPGVRDNECSATCRSDLRGCLGEARTAASECFAGCEDLAAAARAACEADPTGQDCADARAALHGCAQPCAEGMRSMARRCSNTARECVQSCLPVPDDCAAACRTDRRSCLLKAHTNVDECRAGCADERDAARAACSADPESDECAAAREALHACLEPCGQSLGGDLMQCATDLRDCVDGCPAE